MTAPPTGPSGLEPDAVRWDDAGLAPVVVQDAADGRVLMLGWTDREALDQTRSTGEVHFHSRSRGRLWRKGETSGNVLRLVDLALDCDADAILATVTPAGPTCHRGTRSCFDGELDGAPPGQGIAGQGFAWLEQLWATIEDRARERPAGSYTTALLAGGVDATARKVVEEATEVVLAAKDDATAEGSGGDRAVTRGAVRAEAADVLYHLLVLLAERGLSPGDVVGELRRRHERPGPGS